MALSKDKFLSNKGSPVKRVRHSELERFDPVGSLFKSVCPECQDGILLVQRNLETLELEGIDNCIHCGQTFVYVDIEDMRRVLG